MYEELQDYFFNNPMNFIWIEEKNNESKTDPTLTYIFSDINVIKDIRFSHWELDTNKYKTEENFIHGCTSNAWIKLENKDPIQINTISDSMIVSGILYLLEEAFNGEPKSSINNYDGQDLIDGFGLEGTITSQRLRGFAEAVKMMKE